MLPSSPGCPARLWASESPQAMSISVIFLRYGSPCFAVWLDLVCPAYRLPGALQNALSHHHPTPPPSTCSAFNLWVSFTHKALVLPQSDCSYPLVLLF